MSPKRERERREGERESSVHTLFLVWRLRAADRDNERWYEKVEEEIANRPWR